MYLSRVISSDLCGNVKIYTILCERVEKGKRNGREKSNYEKFMILLLETRRVDVVGSVR